MLVIDLVLIVPVDFVLGVLVHLVDSVVLEFALGFVCFFELP